jgi:ribonuclease HI
MNATTPHFLLFSESDRTLDRGQWRFVLQSIDGAEQLEATDTEPDMQGERLELLAVVRGLEALPQPSRVTLVTPSRYVNRGLNYGLPEWRTNDWQWERFGEMAPVKNRDLWQRIDRALEFHSVHCRLWRFDLAAKNDGRRGDEANTLAGPHYLKPKSAVESPSRRELARSRDAVVSSTRATIGPATETPVASRVKFPEPSRIYRHLRCQFWRRRTKLLRLVELGWESLWLRLGQLGTRLLPPPWIE